MRFGIFAVLFGSLLLTFSLASPAPAQQAFDPNLVTCDQVMRGGDELKELTILFTYAFLSGIDFSQGMTVAPLDQDTFASTQAAVESLCEKYPEHSILRMIQAGLEGKPQ